MALAALSPDYGMAQCPFCLKNRVRLHTYSSHGPQFVVLCLNQECEARGPRRHDPDEAMAAWNERGSG